MTYFIIYLYLLLEINNKQIIFFPCQAIHIVRQTKEKDKSGKDFKTKILAGKVVRQIRELFELG